MDLLEGSKPCLTCLDLKIKLEELQKLYEKKDRLSKLLKEYLCTKHSSKIKQEILPPDYDKKPTKDIEDNNYFRQRIVTLTDTVKKLIEEKQSVFLVNKQNKLLIEDYENNQKNFKYANQQLHRQLQSVVEELEENKKILTAAQLELAEFKKKKFKKKKAKDSRVIKDVISSLTQNSELDIVADGEVKAEDIFYPTPVSSTVQSPATSVGSEFPSSTRSPGAAEFASSPAPVDSPSLPDHPCDSSTVYLYDSDESLIQSSETTLEENCSIREETSREENCRTPEKNRLSSEENYSTLEENCLPPEENCSPPEENCTTPEKNRLSSEENYSTLKENCLPPEENCSPPEENCTTPEKNRLSSEENYSTLKENCLPPEENCSTPQENCLPPEENCSTPQENCLPPEENCTTPEENPVSKPSSIVKPITQENEVMEKPDLLPTHSTSKNDKNIFPNRTFTTKTVKSVNPFAFRRNSTISPAKLIFENAINPFQIRRFSTNTEIIDTLLSNLRNLSLKDPEKMNFLNKNNRLDDIQYKLHSTSFNFYRDKNLFKQVIKNEKMITLSVTTDNTQKTIKLEGDPQEAFERLKKITEKSKSFEDFIKRFSSENKPESNLFMTALAENTFAVPKFNGAQFINDLNSKKKNSLVQQKFNFDKLDSKNPFLNSENKPENIFQNGKNKNFLRFPRSLFATDESDLGNEISKKVLKCPEKLSLKKSKLDLLTSQTQKVTDESDLDGGTCKKVPKSQKTTSKKSLITSQTQKVTDESDLDGETCKKVPKSPKTTSKKSLITSQTQKATDESDSEGEICQKVAKSKKKFSPKKPRLNSSSKTKELTDESDLDAVTCKKVPKSQKTTSKKSLITSQTQKATDESDSEGEIRQKVAKSQKKFSPKKPRLNSSSKTKELTDESDFDGENPKIVPKIQKTPEKVDLSTPNESDLDEKLPIKNVKTPRKRSKVKSLSENASDSEEIFKKVERKKPKSNPIKRSTRHSKRLETDLSTADETESEIEENTRKVIKTKRSPRKKLATENLKNAQDKNSEMKNEDSLNEKISTSSDKEEKVQKKEDCPVQIKKPKMETKKNKTIEKLRKSARLIKLKLPEDDEVKLPKTVKTEKPQVSPEPKSPFPNYQVTSKGVKVHLPPESLEKRQKAAEIFKKPRPPKRIFLPETTENVEHKKDEEFDSILKDIQESYKPVCLLAPLNETSLDLLNSDEKCEEISKNENSKEQNAKKEVENNALSETLKPNEETGEICKQKNDLLTDFDINKTVEETDLKNETAISNSTINSEESQTKNVDLPNSDEKIPPFDDDFDSADENSESENKISTVDNIQSEKEKLFAYLDKIEGKVSEEPKQEEDEDSVSDLLNNIPVGFYSKPAEEENLQNNKEAANKKFQKQQISEPMEALECEKNALDCAWNYFTSIKPKKKKKTKSKHQKNHPKAQLAQIEENLKKYMASDDVFSVLPNVVSRLHESANHQMAQIFVKFLYQDKDVGKLLYCAKNHLESTPIQDKILALTFSILVYKRTFLEDILSKLEQELVSFNTNNKAELNVSLAHVHTKLCKKFGLFLRTRTLILDLFYMRQFRAYPIVAKILNLWPKVFPNYRKNEECLMGHTIAQICKKVPSIWEVDTNIAKIYGINSLLSIFSRQLGYCDKYGFTYEYDELFSKLVKNIEYKGNDRAIILLCKCVGFKYACEILKKEMYPKMVAQYETTDENLLAKIILTSGKICKGFPAMDTAVFVRDYIRIVGLILKKSSSSVVCEAAVEALSHVKKYDLEAITNILWNWKPTGNKLSMKSAYDIRRIFNSRNLIKWKYTIHNLKKKTL